MNKLKATLDDEFARLHARSSSFVPLVAPDKLFRQPPRTGVLASHYSCGEHILRSAATVEQTCGGIISNLWDDPFEWTLPETLSTPALILEYLAEVETTRQRAFSSFRHDEDLQKQLALPSGEMTSLLSLLEETLARAADQQERAFRVFRLFSDAPLPRL